MDKIIHVKPETLPATHKDDHANYEFFRRYLVPRRKGGACEIAMFEVPPGKSAFPYHYHMKNEEAFYILSGEGLLKTPEGERHVEGGDFLFFPTGEAGAHKLTNTSETEALRYIDFDTHNDLEVAVYPDSGKIGIWGMDINQVFRQGDSVDYYDGE